MSLDEDARTELAQLEVAHRRRTQRIVHGPQGPTFVLDGRTVVNLSSNDYLSLAGDARLVAAAKAALDEHGNGAGASRLIAGTQRAHALLEDAVRDWMRCAGARLFNSGYAANVGVMSTLLRPGDVVVSDALNHASIIDGCRLSRARVVVYPHGDVAALDAALASLSTEMGQGTRKIVVTESLFSMDGDVADLRAIADVARKRDAALIVDEAHAVGARGPEGRGECATQGVTPDVLVGTFGKALGGFGAFVATSAAIADLLWNRARSFVFSTALPPTVPASARAAIEIVRSGEGDDRRRALASNARQLRVAIPAARGAPDSAIAPLIITSDRDVMAMTARLLEGGVFVQGIRPPTVPEHTARLRISVSSGLAAADLVRAHTEIVAVTGAEQRSAL